MILIQKIEYFKTIETEFKQQLSIDKKYLPISKKLVVLLRQVNPFLETIEHEQSIYRDHHIQQSLSINKAYAENIEKFNQALKMIVEKNHAEIEKSQKSKLHKTHEINRNLKAEFEKIELKISQANQQADDNLAKADMNYKRELSAIQKIIVIAKKNYQQTTQAIEEEKDGASIAIAKAYDQKIAHIEKRIETAKKEHIELIEKQNIDNQEANKNNDDIYLVIKNTYTELSIHLNKKINELKKKHQQAVAIIEKEYQVKIKPVIKAIEDLKVSYQEAQQKSLQSYSEKLNSLNVIFDIQKEAYDTKKNRIIHDSNDAITLLNSKLSAYRETTQKDKLLTSRKIRDEIKSLETVEDKDKMTRALTRELNTFDGELNKQIIRTNKDILLKQREQQRRLFIHDQQHLKEINEWRLKKVVYEYEKKQEFAKIDLNFHHNLSTSEKQLKLIEAHYQYQKEVLLLKHNKDLLPLEFQLAIAAAVQERELNLLGNDAHQSIAYYKYQEHIALYDQTKNLAKLELEIEKAKAMYHADKQVLNVSIQLELEKEKVKRDYAINEQELRIELNQALLNKSTQWIQNQLTQELYVIDSDRELMMIENKCLLDTVKAEAYAEERKREFVVNEAKYRNQQRESTEKATRFLKIYQNELELNQEHTEDFMEIIRMLYIKQVHLKDVLIELYHLPSHPEVLKEAIHTFITLTKELQNTAIGILEQFQTIDQAYYIKKIEDLTGYKYMLKHEDTMNFYAQEILKVEKSKSTIEKKIKQLEEQFFAQQTDLERNQGFINQLTKISQNIKDKTTKNEHKYHEIKENQKLLSNHEEEIKRIRKELSKIEKEIDANHQSIIPLDREIQQLSEKQKDAELHLDQDKHQEASSFYRFLSRNQAIYQSFAQDIQTHYQATILFYQALEQEVYVSEAFLTQELKKLDKNLMIYERSIILYHQRFLDLMSDFYHKNAKEQLHMIKGFKKSTQALVKSLNQNYENVLNTSSTEQKRRQLDKDRRQNVQKDKIKKKLELENMSYQKKLSIDQMTLKSIESKITENSDKQMQELDLLNANQISIAGQYNAEYQEKLRHLDEGYKKQTSSIDQNISSADKNFKGIEDSVRTKNQVLLSKYQASHQKNVESLKQKTEHYLQLIEKANQADIERQKNSEKTLRRMARKRESELHNIIDHHKGYIKMTKNSQDRVLKKELRLLKKSHHFKVRMLHLN